MSLTPIYGKTPAFIDGNGMYYYIDHDSTADNETSTSDTDTSEDTENNSFLRIFRQVFPIALIILGLKTAIGFMRRTIEGD